MTPAKTYVSRAFALLLLLAVLLPALAHAEPRPSSAHIPLLWLLAVAGSFLVAAGSWILMRRIGSGRGSWKARLIAVVLGLLFLLLVGPVIVGLGSILITGRTM